MATAELASLDFGALESFDVHGTAVELFRAGSGEPLLFLHGVDSLEGAAAGIRELAKSFQVFAPSHPGFGASGLPSHINRVDDIGYLYLDMLDLLGLAAPVIVGTSFGAWVACEMLTKEPSRARALVLASPLGIKTSDRREQWVTDIFMISKEELAERLQVSPPEGPPLTEMDEWQMRRALRADEALSLFSWSPYMSNPKLIDRLHRIVCPAMVIWGDQDALIEPEYSLRWSDALPRAHVEVLPGAGHRSHYDKPAELAAMVKKFVAGVES